MLDIRKLPAHRLGALGLAVAAVLFALTLTLSAGGTGETVAGDTHTVFLDVAALGRRSGAAEKMNKLHADMATQGYDFSDLEIYTENGDLEGFFLTYQRRR